MNIIMQSYALIRDAIALQALADASDDAALKALAKRIQDRVAIVTSALMERPNALETEDEDGNPKKIRLNKKAK